MILSGVRKRLLHTSAACLKGFEEVRIPVPWGHISGKWWGDRSKVPIVGLHGLLDNAATFDNLAPLLEAPSFLSLDLPGHGHSSHMPLGIMRHFYDNVVQVRYVLKNHFGWSNLTLLGHSFGAAVWYHYSSFFPEDVSKYISIDGATFTLATRPEDISFDMRSLCESHLKIEEKKKNFPPEYEFDELVEHMYQGRKNLGLTIEMSLTRDSCRTLMSRGARKSPSGKYFFSRDLQLNSRSFGHSTVPFLFALAERMSCEVLFIRASKGIIIDKWLEQNDQTVNHMRKKSKRIEYETIEGGHHLHLEKPERVAPVINNFINS